MSESNLDIGINKFVFPCRNLLYFCAPSLSPLYHLTKISYSFVSLFFFSFYLSFPHSLISFYTKLSLISIYLHCHSFLCSRSSLFSPPLHPRPIPLLLICTYSFYIVIVYLPPSYFFLFFLIPLSLYACCFKSHYGDGAFDGEAELRGKARTKQHGERNK